ncbi:uncharacterized protein LOC124267402 [Haliotis rubra]|uniref:uncharacterized protein LOC124267402 n=1 Tax=Haliotis rubra TaxID=36100 RepID=UPI001EE566B7|nr:uncharacterized protein LOC124267402 [Haliotis rubra]
MGSGASKTFPVHQFEEYDDTVCGNINCSPYIACSDISLFMQSQRDRLLACDRRVLQCCLSVIAEESSWVWRHASLEVHGRQLAVMFYSGDRDNKYVVCINNDGITSQCVSRGLRLKLRDGFRSVWNWIGNAARKVVGAIGGAGMKMLTF